MTNLDNQTSRIRQHYPAPTIDPVEQTPWKLYDVNPSVTIVSAVTTIAWTSLDITDPVPLGATHVQLQIEWSKSGGALSQIDFRQMAKGVTIAGASATATDTGSTQIVVPVLSLDRKRSIDYQITGSSFGTTLTVKVTGYYK